MEAFFWGGVFFLTGLLLQELWIRLQQRMRVSQVQKSYGIGIDADIKSKVPSMGGVIFLVLSLVALALRLNCENLLFWSLPLTSGSIGLTDDILKFASRSSEGFRSLKKLRVQLVVTAVWVFLVYMRSGLALWPGVSVSLALTLPLAFLGVAGIINAVNITDGLDGLAGGCFLISLGVLCCLLPSAPLNRWVLPILFAAAASFLFYNMHPARTFMGDTGAHFLGGALAALCVQNGMILALVPAGFMFGLELLSSAVQIVAIRKFERKVFRMAPLHHHFQRIGWSETTVTMRFWLVHAVGAAWLSVFFVFLWGN